MPRRRSRYSDLPGSVLLKHASEHSHLLLYTDRTTWWAHLAWILFVASLRLAGFVMAMTIFCGLLPLARSGSQSAFTGVLFLSTLLSLFFMVRDQHERGYWGIDSRVWIHTARRKIVAEVVTSRTRRHLQRVLAMDQFVLRGWTSEYQDETSCWQEVHLGLFHRAPANSAAPTELVGLHTSRGLAHRSEVEALGIGLSTCWNIPFEKDF